MSTSLLAHRVSQHTGVDTAVCATVLRGVAEVVRHEWRQGHSVNIPNVGIVEPAYFKARSVACNLPHRIRRRYDVGIRKSARLRPSPNLKSKEPYTCEKAFPPAKRDASIFIIP